MRHWDSDDWVVAGVACVVCIVLLGAVVLGQAKQDRARHDREVLVTHLCVAALVGRPPVEQVRLLAAFPECAPALADTTVTPRRGR